MIWFLYEVIDSEFNYSGLNNINGHVSYSKKKNNVYIDYVKEFLLSLN